MSKAKPKPHITVTEAKELLPETVKSAVDADKKLLVVLYEVLNEVHEYDAHSFLTALRQKTDIIKAARLQGMIVALHHWAANTLKQHYRNIL